MFVEYVEHCRIDGCGQFVHGRSTLCLTHIGAGRGALNKYLGRSVIQTNRWDRDDTVHLYVIRAGEAVKFGTANDVIRRFDELQIANYLQIDLLGSIPVLKRMERILHERLSTYRIRGEWYRWDGPVIDLAEAIKAGDFGRLNALIRELRA